MGDVMGDVVSYFHICYLYSNILLIVKNFSPLSTILLTAEMTMIDISDPTWTKSPIENLTAS